MLAYLEQNLGMICTFLSRISVTRLNTIPSAFIFSIYIVFSNAFGTDLLTILCEINSKKFLSTSSSTSKSGLVASVSTFANQFLTMHISAKSRSKDKKFSKVTNFCLFACFLKAREAQVWFTGANEIQLAVLL